MVLVVAMEISMCRRSSRSTLGRSGLGGGRCGQVHLGKVVSLSDGISDLSGYHGGGGHDRDIVTVIGVSIVNLLSGHGMLSNFRIDGDFIQEHQPIDEREE